MIIEKTNDINESYSIDNDLSCRSKKIHNETLENINLKLKDFEFII